MCPIHNWVFDPKIGEYKNGIKQSYWYDIVQNYNINENLLNPFELFGLNCMLFGQSLTKLPRIIRGYIHINTMHGDTRGQSSSETSKHFYKDRNCHRHTF